MIERTAPILANAAPTAATRGYRAAMIAVYVVAFLVALPCVLWELGGRFDRWFELMPLSHRAGWALFVTLALPGFWLMVRATRALWSEGGGLPISHLPPARLVTTGAFRRLRHPIYVGSSLAFAGMGAASGSFGRAAGSTGLLTVAWLAYAAGLEEPTLRRRFGKSYERYLNTTSRWPIPIAEPWLEVGFRAWMAVRPAVERLANQTVLFRSGGHVFVTYGLFVAAGVAASSALGTALFADQLAGARLDEYLLVLGITLPIGGRLAWLIYQAPRLARAPRATLRSVGFVSFGAYVAAFLVLALWPRWRAPQTEVWSLLDRTLVACFLCSAFGRIGCHTYGCCYGKPAPYGISVGEPLAKVVRERGPLGHEARWPTQLISSGWALFVAALGFVMIETRAPSGVPAALLVLVYALGRFGLESLRDEPLVWADRFTRGQLACLALAAAAVSLLLASPFRFAAPSPVFSIRWNAVFTHGPTIVFVSAFVFIVCGYHRNEVGRW